TRAGEQRQHPAQARRRTVPRQGRLPLPQLLRPGQLQRRRMGHLPRPAAGEGQRRGEPAGRLRQRRHGALRQRHQHRQPRDRQVRGDEHHLQRRRHGSQEARHRGRRSRHRRLVLQAHPGTAEHLGTDRIRRERHRRLDRHPRSSSQDRSAAAAHQGGRCPGAPRSHLPAPEAGSAIAGTATRKRRPLMSMRRLTFSVLTLSSVIACGVVLAMAATTPPAKPAPAAKAAPAAPATPATTATPAAKPAAKAPVKATTPGAIKAETIPPGYHFPTPRKVIDGWVAVNATGKFRAHAWDVWAGMTAPSHSVHAGQRLPIWETWYSENEVFVKPGNKSEAEAVRTEVKRPFAKPRQLFHVANAKGLATPASNEQVVAFNKFDPESARFLMASHPTPKGSANSYL